MMFFNGPALSIVFLATVVPLVVSILSHILIRNRRMAWCIAICSSMGAAWIPLLVVYKSEMTRRGFQDSFWYGGLTAFVISLVVGAIAEAGSKLLSKR